MDVPTAAKECVENLQTIIKSQDANKRQQAWAEDQCARFKLWGSSLGVFAPDRFSIQHRLRLNPQLLEVILQLLKGLLASIRLYLKSLSGTTNPKPHIREKENTEPKQAHDDDSSESSEAEDPVALLAVRAKEIRDRIGRLMRFSVLLRRDGAERREARALSYEPVDSLGNSLVPEFLSILNKVFSRMFDKEAPTELGVSQLPDFMRDRLKCTILIRWRRLSYNNHHAKALAQRGSGLGTDIKAPKLPNLEVARPPGRETLNSRVNDGIKISTVNAAPSRKSKSAASTAARDLKYDSKVTARPLSAGTATTKIKATKVDIPRAPSVPDGVDEFECPFCRMLCSVKERERSLWPIHVMHDLAPYICLFKDCAESNSMFRTSSAWVEHMTKSHCRTTWSCTKCSPKRSAKSVNATEGEFTTADAYEAHLKTEHQSAVDEGSMSLLLQMNGRRQLHLDGCMFCDFGHSVDVDLEELVTHIGEDHLHEMALLSLPWDVLGADDADSAIRTASTENGPAQPPQHQPPVAKATTTTGQTKNDSSSCVASLDEIKRSIPAIIEKDCRHDHCLEAKESKCLLPRVNSWQCSTSMTEGEEHDRATAERSWAEAMAEIVASDPSILLEPLKQVEDEADTELPVKGLDSAYPQEDEPTALELGVNTGRSWQDEENALLEAALAGDDRELDLLASAGVDLTSSWSEGLNALHLSAERGHLKCINIILDHGLDIESRADNGGTALCIAAMHQQSAAVQLLLSRGANPNALSEDWGTPLHAASACGNAAIVEMLLDSKATSTIQHSFDLKNFRSLPGYKREPWLKWDLRPLGLWEISGVKSEPLNLAAYFGHLDVVQLLLSTGVKVDAPASCWFNLGPESASVGTALSFAALNNHREVVSALLDQGANLEYIDSDSDTPLLTAAYFGAIDAMRELVDRGANLEATDSRGYNALIRCLSHRRAHECASYLLGLGLDVNFKAKSDGLSPLMAATSRMLPVEEVQFLLDAGASIHERNSAGLDALWYASGNSDYMPLTLLLGRGARASITSLSGQTPLMMAASHGLKDNVALLLAQDIDVRVSDSGGGTALSFAASNGHAEVVRLLLVPGGATPNTQDKDAKSPLMFSAVYGYSKTVQLLLGWKGIQLDVQDNDGETALMKAAKKNHAKCLQYIVDAGAKVDVRDKNSNTALECAVKRGHVECVQILGPSSPATTIALAMLLAAKQGNAACLRVLHEAGAPLNAYDDHRMTPLMLACSKGHFECARLLLDAGATMHPQDKRGNSAIHLACDEGVLDCIRLLLQYGAEPDQPNSRGRTPLMKVSASWSPSAVACAELLIQHGALIDRTDGNGGTALSRALFGSVEMLRCLVENHAQLDATDDLGHTVLMHASSYGYIREATILIDAGASVDLANPLTGHTALARALCEEELDMAEFLESRGASLEAAVKAMSVQSLQSCQSRLQLVLQKKNTQPDSDDDSVLSSASRQRDSLSTESCERILAGINKRIEALEAAKDPLVALTPRLRDLFKRKVASIRRRRERPRAERSISKQVSFVPPPARDPL